MKKGNLVKHKSRIELGKSTTWVSPDLGIGIIVESWENQTRFDGVPEHNPDERIVLFNSGYRVMNISDLEFVNKVQDE